MPKMPRISKQHVVQRTKENTLVVDNGAYTIKAGFTSSSNEEQPDLSRDCHIIPNCIARGTDQGRGQKIYIADQLDKCKYFASLGFRRPVERGFIVNWDGELDIWKQAFFNDDAKLKCDPHETNLVLTEAPNCPHALQSNTDQMIFEEFEFASAYRCVGPSLNAYNDIPALMGTPSSTLMAPSECLLVIDSGYSHTTITPLLRGRPVQSAIRRFDIGGKFLTNVLVDNIAVRHYDLREEPYLVNQMKEDACFVSQQFRKDMDQIRLKPYQGILVDYILPDFHSVQRGYLRAHNFRTDTKARAKSAVAAPATTAASYASSPDDFVPLGYERIAPPELLFNPSDIGMGQAGIPEIAIQSLKQLPSGLWPGMLANIVVVGGTSKLDGFVARLESELRALSPSDCELRVKCPADPIKYTWLGGARMAKDKTALASKVVTRAEYLEHGSSWTARVFASGGSLR